MEEVGHWDLAFKGVSVLDSHSLPPIRPEAAPLSAFLLLPCYPVSPQACSDEVSNHAHEYEILSQGNSCLPNFLILDIFVTETKS